MAGNRQSRTRQVAVHRAGYLMLFLLFVPQVSSAQWKELFKVQAGRCISVYFDDEHGRPETGFIGGTGPGLGGWEGYANVYRTTDRGKTWDTLHFDEAVGGINDFVFEDSSVGLLATFGSGVGGVYKTTDGGLTWSRRLEGSILGLTYYKPRNEIFAAGPNQLFGFCGVRSTDDGEHWLPTNACSGSFVQTRFVFADSLNGILAMHDPLHRGAIWHTTIDGGITWTPLTIDSGVLDPIAIPGTKTYSAVTKNGNLLRTDDQWRSWRVVHSFPAQTSSPFDIEQSVSSGCLRHNGCLYVCQFVDGISISDDECATWTLLPLPTLYLRFSRFHFQDRRLYVPTTTADDAPMLTGRVWMLDLSNDLRSSWQGGNSEHHFKLGEQAKVRCTLSNGWTDSLFLRVDFDPEVFEWLKPELPSGWTYRTSLSVGSIDLTIIRPTGAEHDTTFLLDFSTKLSKPRSMIVVQPLAVHVDALNLPCLAEASQRSDTLTALFDGCGNDLIWHFMQTGSIFELLSAEPNPATNELRVGVRMSESRETVRLKIYDLLGDERLARDLTSPSTTLDVSTLPTGTYFLRLSSQGEIRTRRFVIDR